VPVRSVFCNVIGDMPQLLLTASGRESSSCLVSAVLRRDVSQEEFRDMKGWKVRWQKRRNGRQRKD